MAATRLTADPPFIGRTAELGRLNSLVAEAANGRGGIALLAGEPGIGKTRLTEELATTAVMRGDRVLWGRCYEGEGAPAFWPWIQILRSLIGIGGTVMPHGGHGVDRAETAMLAPELRALLTDTGQPPAPASAEARFRLFDSITGCLTTAAASTPLLLLLDDLHCADIPSLLLLEFLAQALADVPILAVGAYRDTEAGDGRPLTRTLGVLLRQRHVSHVALGGLSEAEIAQLIRVAGTQPSDHLAAAIMRQTEGNPLFVTEMLRLLAADSRQGEDGPGTTRALGIPRTVRAVISRRLESLSPATNAALTLAAVIGREFTTTMLVAAGETAPDALTEAEAARIITPVLGVPGGYRFTHALTQETLYAALPSARRMRLHQRVGEAIAARHDDDPDPPLAELAYHFSQAAPVGDAAWAVTFARRAGDKALATLAYEEAARLYQLGLEMLGQMPRADVLERCELLLALGEAQSRAADTSAGQAAFWQAVAFARVLEQRGANPGAASVLARAALGIAGPTLPAHPVATELVDLLLEAQAALGEADTPLRAQILARLATDLRGPDDQPRRVALSEEAVAVARRAGDPRALAVALLGRHNVERGTTQLEEQLALATEALQQAETAEDSDLAMWAYRLRVVDLMEIGDLAAFDRDAAAYARLAERLREPYHFWQSTVWQAMRSLLAGRFAEAEALAEQALALGERGPADLARLFHALQLAAIRTEYGAPDEGIAVAAPVLEQFPLLQGVTAALLPLYLAAGRREEAQREYDRLIAAAPAADVAQLPRRGVWLAVVSQLASAAAALGDTSRAAALSTMLLPDAGRIAMASPGIVWYGPVAHYLGLLGATTAASAADWGDVAHHFEEAIATEMRLGARAWLARTRYEYAAMLVQEERAEMRRKSDDEDVARALLEEASAGARELQMERLADRADRLLATLRAQPPSSGLPPPLPDGLSPREVEVLRLLAEGKTNAEIAALLVLSPSTVKRHAENIYLKIGARRRADAIAYALRHGLIER